MDPRLPLVSFLLHDRMSVKLSQLLSDVVLITFNDSRRPSFEHLRRTERSTSPTRLLHRMWKTEASPEDYGGW